MSTYNNTFPSIEENFASCMEGYDGDDALDACVLKLSQSAPEYQWDDARDVIVRKISQYDFLLRGSEGARMTGAQKAVLGAALLCCEAVCGDSELSGIEYLSRMNPLTLVYSHIFDDGVRETVAWETARNIVNDTIDAGCSDDDDGRTLTLINTDTVLSEVSNVDEELLDAMFPCA